MKTQVYLVLTTDGNVRVMETKGYMTLETMKEIVGGYIEIVNFGNADDIIIVANEEGLLLDLPPNPFFLGIVGNIILAKSEPPEIAGLTGEDLNIICAALQLISNEEK